MDPKDIPVDETSVLDVDTEDPDPILTEEALEVLTKGFGKGTTGRKILVTKGMSLTELSRISK
jgi:hypothetical protein